MPNYIIVNEAKALLEHVKRMRDEGKPISIDIESGFSGPEVSQGISLRTFHPLWKMVSVQFTNSEDYAIFVPIGFDKGDNINELAAAALMWKLVNTGLGMAHNASFELQALGRWFRDTLGDHPTLGPEVRASRGYFPVFSDTMIEAKLYGIYEQVGLKELTHNVLHEEQEDLLSLFKRKGFPKMTQPKIRFNILDGWDPEVVNYACDDVTKLLKHHKINYPNVKDMQMFKVEMKLQQILVNMEYEGIYLDWDMYYREEHRVSQFLELFNEDIQKRFSDRLGEVVNVNFGSPKQTVELVYEKLGMPVKHRTKTDAPSTDEKAMRDMARKDPDIKRILQWREIKKLLGSYLTKYIKELHYDPSGFAHPNHNQLGADTGRMSVDHVSYQQWPKGYHYETSDGSASYDLNYRDFMISPPGFRIVGYDYANVELRVLAGMANEQVMIQAFNSGEDIHKATASTMLGVPLKEVTKAQRAVGKTLNFAICYGSGADNIAELIGCSVEQAKQYLEDYFIAFPGLKAWMDSKVVEGRQQGYVETLFGRRFEVWGFKSGRSFHEASHGERLCVNAPVQGGAADYMKIAMCRASAAIKKAGLEDKVILVATIHDALEFYVHESISTQEVIDLLNPMVAYKHPGLPALIKADWHEGYRWGSVRELVLDKDMHVTGYEYTHEPINGDKVEFEAQTLDQIEAEILAWHEEHDFKEAADAPSEPAQHDVPSSPEPEEEMEPQATEVIITFNREVTEKDLNVLDSYKASHPGQLPLVLYTLDAPIPYALVDGEDLNSLSALLGGLKIHKNSLDPAPF